MLLSILTQKFPIFNSNDDIEALMEIAAIFGRSAIERCAMLHSQFTVALDWGETIANCSDRTMVCNVPTLETNPDSIKNLILKLNPHIFTPPLTHPSSADARAHIEAMDQAIDLCTRLLRLDVTKRPTAAVALRHPFFEGLVDDEDLVVPEVLSGLDGRCGALHGIDDTGRRKLLPGDPASHRTFN
jgi:cell division control protein 7